MKLQQLEQQLVAARAKESAEEQEKRRRDEDHLAVLQTRTEQKDSEARALAEERLQKQLLAEQKEKKLQELREKWVVSVAEQTTARGKGAKDKEGGAAKDGKKKRKKGQQTEVGDEEGDEEDEALMRVLNSKGGSSNIDFGSSGEEDGDSDADQQAPARSLRARAAVPAATDDLFGDSDDEADSTKARAAPTDDDEDALSGAPARKRLRKAGGASGQAAGGPSDDEGEMDMDAPSSSNGAADTTVRKQHRVIDDDSD